MPRANRYLLEGQIVHVTHRCHDKAALLNHRVYRNKYGTKLRKVLGGSKSRLLGYCITCNHVHLLFLPDSVEDLSKLMQRCHGEFAEAYNLEKERTGAFWTDRYHATMVQDDNHLWRCLRYIDLNMVRAGVVRHPSEWKWCGYHELVGKKKRYRLIDLEWWVSWSGSRDIEEFQRGYASWVESGISMREGMTREPWWTDAIAVGNRDYVRRFETQYPNRFRLEVDKVESGSWTLREPTTPYGTQNR